MKVDKINWAILTQLQQNARISVKELAKQVSLSSPAVAERIHKMELAGIISRHTTELNLKCLGYQLGVYISIKIRFGQVKNFETYVQTIPEVCECHKLTGNDCMLMKAHVRDPEHLEMLTEKLAQYGELTTSLILSSIVKNRLYDAPY